MDINEVRKKRTNAESIFVKFIKNRDLFNKKIFCFFEGEDQKYYGIRIEKYTEINEIDTVFYQCGGKSQVLKLYQMLKKDYSDVKKMFFIDRDFDIVKDIDDIYITPCYSIENFYVNERTFGQILHKEFGINFIDADFKKCMKDYKERKKEYNAEIINLNAWLYYQKDKMKEEGTVNINYQNLKLNKYFDIKIDRLIVKKNFTIETLKKEYKQAYEMNQDDLEIYKGKLEDENLLRGKYQVEFFKAILNDLIEKNKNNIYFENYIEAVKLNPNINFLGTFSIYAETPKTLIEFLKKYKGCLIV
jgi:hypothetical protein